MSSEYEHVVRGSLKLKRSAPPVADGRERRKKRKEQSKSDTSSSSSIALDAKTLERLSNEELLQLEKNRRDQRQSQVVKTKAELAFQKRQEELQMNRIVKKAEKSHKERVEDFNSKLDQLTEHYDIPKVSWTK